MTDQPDIVEQLRFEGKHEPADEILALRAQLAEARAAFRKYGRHDARCKGTWPSARRCTCGFSAARAKLGEG